MTLNRKKVTPNRPWVVLLHGFMGSGEDWHAVRRGLSTHFNCCCPDLPGHGENPLVTKAGVGGLEDGVHWLTRRLDDWEVKRGGLVGYSMGGRLALLMALRHAERFSGVVLESTSPGLKTSEERALRQKHDLDLVAELVKSAGDPILFRTFLEWWYDQPLFASLHEHGGLVKWLIDMRCKGGNPAALAEALGAFSTGAQPSLWDSLSDHDIPTLLIVGERDRKFRFIAEEMAERCPAMAVEVFAGCGHNVHLENPDGYTTVVRSFLCTNPGT